MTDTTKIVSTAITLFILFGFITLGGIAAFSGNVSGGIVLVISQIAIWLFLR